MKTPVFIFTIFLPLFLAQPLGRQPCARTCSFGTCFFLLAGNIRRPLGAQSLVGPPKSKIGRDLCKGRRIMSDVTLGEALIARNGRDGRVRISTYGLPGLSKPFKPNFFFALNTLENSSSISRSRTTKEQADLLNNACVAIPIESYRLRKRDGSAGTLKRTRGRDSDCVEIRTVVPRLHFSLEWTVPGDLDLIVEEPNGELVNRFNPISSTGGRLLLDLGINDLVCGGGQRRKVREDVRWLKPSAAETGTYTVSIQQTRKCIGTPIKWTLTVLVDGVVEKKFVRTTSIGNGQIANTFTLDLTF